MISTQKISTVTRRNIARHVTTNDASWAGPLEDADL